MASVHVLHEVLYMSEGSTGKSKKQMPAYTVQPVRSPRASVSPCPTTAHLPEEKQHKNRKIYKTDGRIRRCRCDDCGETWKMVPEEPNESCEYLKDLAVSLEKAGTTVVEGDTEPVILIPESEAKLICHRLRAIAAGQ